jgi:hypothetical protein
MDPHHIKALPSSSIGFINAAPYVVHPLPAACVCLQAHHARRTCRVLIAATCAQLVPIWRGLAAAIATAAGAAGCWLLLRLLLLLLLISAYEWKAACFLLRVILLTTAARGTRQW